MTYVKHVDDFGADPTGVNDSSAAFNACIQDVSDNGGGVADNSGGRYRIDNQVTIKKHVTLRGEHTNKWVNRQATANNTGVTGVYPATALLITHGRNTLDPTFVLETQAGGIENQLISYPDQDITELTPTPYAPTIGNADPSFIFGAAIRNILCYNPYIFMQLDNGGLSVVEDILLFPSHIGFDFQDKISECMGIRGVRFYPLHSGNLETYAKANATGFKLSDVDGVNFYDITGFGLKTMIHTVGQTWANFFGIVADNCMEPIIIEDADLINFVGGTLVGDVDAGYESGNSAINIKGMVNPSGIVNLDSVNVYNFPHAVDISANRGQCNISNLGVKTKTNASGAARYDGNNVSGAAIIDQGNGMVVQASNVARGLHKKWEHIFGSGETLSIDGIKLPNRGADVTPVDIATTSVWGNNTHMSDIPFGIEFDMSHNLSTATYQFSSDVSNLGIAMLEIELEQDFIDPVSSGCKFDISVRDTAGQLTRMFDNGYVPHYEKKRKYMFPVILNPSEVNKLHIEYGGQASAGTIKLTNISLYECDDKYVTVAFVDAIYGTERYSTHSGRLL